MKYIFYAMLLAIGLSSCKPGPFTGRIVDKEYVPGHRCHTSDFNVKQEASLLPAIVVPHTVSHPVHHHKWVNATVTVWVANRDQLKPFSVDTLSYDKWIVGSKITF